MFVAAAAAAAVAAARGQGNLHYRHYLVNDKCIYLWYSITYDEYSRSIAYMCAVCVVYAVFSK
jgi:hypothetical protein